MAFEIHNKDDIEFVNEFPCFLGHPVLLEKVMKAILDLVQHELFTVLYRPVRYRTVITVPSCTVQDSNSCTVLYGTGQ